VAKENGKQSITNHSTGPLPLPQAPEAAAGEFCVMFLNLNGSSVWTVVIDDKIYLWRNWIDINWVGASTIYRNISTLFIMFHSRWNIFVYVPLTVEAFKLYVQKIF